MSTIIGIYVRRQPGTPYENNRYPKESPEELGNQFRAHILTKFPEAKNALWSAGVDYTSILLSPFQDKRANEDEKIYEFWVQPGNWIKVLGCDHEMKDLWLATVEFIFSKFSHFEHVEMKTYWSC